ncbi:glycosyltransferase family 4 protein [Mangrovimonas sp. AS39]|uniref:glycosyltransferase family 4 protein n=1 Tax=Mangrovimonas futianensis TaxID=2895523 RepID=UPI001E5C5346|nr:glycosyltransferase family 4 protein [Mangrovimonas futianensis]MCF1191221.1 glycosyltransferase family 4 protein [Mangrovimonas futianensis]MCF1194916.1 glycosyltransferase family 4 protein [Mangrovimonas futianensis]
MKVLILYTHNKGFLSKFYFACSVSLKEDGHEVYNFSLKSEASYSLHNGVHLVIKEKRGYFHNYYQIYAIIKEVQPDVIISNFSYVNPALLFGKLLGVKKNIAWFHTLQEQIQATRFHIFIKTQFLKLADTMIANSIYTKKDLVKLYGVHESKISILPFWSQIDTLEQDSEPFQTKGDVFSIGCPGRLTEDKNQQLVIHVVKRVVDMGYEKVHVFFAGSGDKLEELKQLSFDLSLDLHLTFLGNLSSEAMISFYRNMDLIVLPSLYEAFGLVFIEAISLGRSVLVSSQFGALTFIDDMVYPIEHFSFDPNSVDSLLEKILPYIQQTVVHDICFQAVNDAFFGKQAILVAFKKMIVS